MVVYLATMTEYFLHYVWQHQFFDTANLRTTDDETICILHLGTYNTNAGPDFLNAKIKIGTTLWYGDVEIHKNSNDWYNHKHHTNKAYNSVILHVVLQFNKNVNCTLNNTIPTFVVSPHKKVLQAYQNLSSFPIQNCCNSSILKVDTFTQNNWFDRLLIERFEVKSEQFISCLEQTNSNWEACFYKRLAHNFGFKQNALAFDSLAESLPLRILLKHKDSLIQLEALFFGQASLLPQDSNCDYVALLHKEYKFLKHKYNLKPIPNTYWKYSRLRPQNAPDMRVAQFAQFIFQSHSVCSHILENRTREAYFNYFSIQLHPYWHTHYKLGKETDIKIKKLGKSSIKSIIINTVIPFMFAYGHYYSKDMYKQVAVDLLDTIEGEQNSIIKKWTDLGIQSDSAFRSQALIHLSQEYCENRACIHCRFGQKYLQSL